MGTAIVLLQSITAKSLREQAFVEALPEIYALKNVVENGSWHSEQNVLDHVIAVLEALERLLTLDFVDHGQRAQLKKYLAQPVDGVTKCEALIAATLLHDMAKIDTLVRHPNGTTSCPGHALIGAARVAGFAERFGLSVRAVEHIERIVRYHGLISELLDLAIAKNNNAKYAQILFETAGDVAIDLILFMRADLLGSDLGKNDRHGLEQRLAVLNWMLPCALSNESGVPE